MQALEILFHPRSLAIVGAGANPESMGTRYLTMIRDYGFTGPLYAVNRAGEACESVPGYRRVTDIPQPVDLCLIAVPAKEVDKVVQDCAFHGVPVAQILTSGFGETGPAGRAQEEVVRQAARGVTRLAGPNCLGTHCPTGHLTFVRGADPTPGRVSVITQSGGLGADILLQARARGLRFSKLVSIGNCVDLEPTDYLSYLGNDSQTDVIGLYIEGIRDGQRFLAELRRVTPKKPVIILKGGRTVLGSHSAASHTGSLATDYQIWQSAVAGAGALDVNCVDDLLAALTALQPGVPLPRGTGMALVGNGGGVTVLAADLMSEHGLTFSQLSQDTLETLTQMSVPAGCTVGNPTDIPAGALNKSGGEVLGQVISHLFADPGVDTVVAHFNLVPLVNYDKPERLADGLAQALTAAAGQEKPLYVALRSNGEPVLEALKTRVLAPCGAAGLPCFHDVSEAVRAASVALRRARFLPPSGEHVFTQRRDTALLKARSVISAAIAAGTRALSQEAAFTILDAFDIPHPPVQLARTPEEATAAASKVSFPVALKIESPDILHKTEAGGIRLGLPSPEAVVDAFINLTETVKRYQPKARITGTLVQAMATRQGQELICGCKRDPIFGPVVLLGLGGVLAELFRDVSVRVLPISPDDPGAMWRELRGAPLLCGYRGSPPADVMAVEDLVFRVAALADALPEIIEMDLNPVMVASEGEGLTVVDCRILVVNRR